MPPAPQGGGQSDNSAGIIWTVAAIFVVIGVVWFTFKARIIAFYLTIKLYEVDLLSYFSPAYYEQIRKLLISAIANAKNVSFDQMGALGGVVGETLRWPFGIALVLLAIIVYFGNSTRVYRRAYNMKDLAKLEQVNYPQISAVTGLDLIKTDIDKGPWAMAMSPMQFCKRYRLLEEFTPQRREGQSRKENRIEVVLKRGDSNKLFALQLGPLWKSVDHLPPHTKALFAVFAARINADSKSAQNLLSQLSSSAGSKLNFTGVDALIKKHINSKEVQRITQSHAYVLTVMMSMLEGARDDGVQASADFLWLKPLDRRLWYTLNTVGRQTPFVEVAGIFAHWLAEREAGRKLLVPMVEEATRAVELALKEVIYRPDEETKP